MLTRTLVDELVSVMKLKSALPDSTLLILVQFTLQVSCCSILQFYGQLNDGSLQDAGGTLPPHCLLADDIDPNNQKLSPTGEGQTVTSQSTGAFDCIRPHLSDVVDFLADVHTLSKLKSNSRAISPGPGLDEDTLGGTVKAGMAQLLALELVRGNGKDNRCIQKYMPWLLNPPSSIQQGYGLNHSSIFYLVMITVSSGRESFSSACVTCVCCLGSCWVLYSTQRS